MLCRFNALDIATGSHRAGSPTAPVAGSRTFLDSDFPNNATTFVAIKQLQRPGECAPETSLLLCLSSQTCRDVWVCGLSGVRDEKTRASLQTTSVYMQCGVVSCKVFLC